MTTKYKNAKDKIDAAAKRRMLKLLGEMKKPDETKARVTIVETELIQPPPSTVPEDKGQSAFIQPAAWEDRDLRPGFSLGER